MARKKRSLRTQWARRERQVVSIWHGNRFTHPRVMAAAQEDAEKAIAHLREVRAQGPLNAAQQEQWDRLTSHRL